MGGFDDAAQGMEDIRARVGEIKAKRAALEKREKDLKRQESMILAENISLREEKRQLSEEMRTLRDMAFELSGTGNMESELQKTLIYEIEGFQPLQGKISREGYLPENMTSAPSFVMRHKRPYQPEKKRIKTLLHQIVESTSKKGSVSTKRLSRELETDQKTVETWAEILASRGFLYMQHSVLEGMVLKKRL